MRRWPVPEANDLKPGEKILTKVMNRVIAIVNVDGELFSVGNVCGHQGGPVATGGLFDDVRAQVDSDGEVVEYVASPGSVISCPWHGWEYDVRTGECLWNKRFRIATFRVQRDEDGSVFLLGR